MKEQVTEIVAAYLRKNRVAADDIPAIIAQVYQSLVGLGQSLPSATIAEPRIPRVPIRRSISADFITCLECGHKATMLKRHLHIAHNLTPEDYRQRWSLPADYPVVAPKYAARRSELAKVAGFGKRGTGRKTARAKISAS
jgi:predicted transcriptional regulator